MLQRITPISKASLKRQCLIIADGDLKKAKEYYDFWVDGMEEELPVFDPQQPSWVDTLGSRVNGLLDWAKEHQDVLNKGVELLNNLIGRRGNVSALAESAESLEEIND